MGKKQGFLSGVRKEFGKITWPTKNTVVNSTLVIIVAILIVSGIVSLLDFIFRTLLSFAL